MDATHRLPAPRRPLRRALRNWLERHRHPFNFWIHLFGIPLSLAGLVLFFALPWGQWYLGVVAFVLGYVLQYVGHRVEGNDLGEWAGIKRLLGLPYVCISPRWRESADSTQHAGANQPRQPQGDQSFNESGSAIARR